MHHALADPLRIRLYEVLWVRPQSAKELAQWANMPPDHIYYHLTRLERAGLIEIAEYRPLAGGKVERVYRPTSIEPPGDEATPLDLSLFLGAALEATRADVTSACEAKEEGQRREVSLTRTAVRLSEARLAKLQESLLELIRQAQDEPDDEGIWTRVVVTLVDLQDRSPLTNSGESDSTDS